MITRTASVVDTIGDLISRSQNAPCEAGCYVVYRNQIKIGGGGYGIVLFPLPGSDSDIAGVLLGALAQLKHDRLLFDSTGHSEPAAACQETPL